MRWLFPLIALFVCVAGAQTQGFYKDRLEGSYIYAMLQYASYEVTSCPEDVAELTIFLSTDDYLCVTDTDDVRFDDDVTTFVRESGSNDVVGTDGWHALMEDYHILTLYFSNGYKLNIVTNGETAVLAGSAR